MAKHYRYVPFVRWKQNDRAGLANLSAQGRENVAPLIQLWPDQYSGPPRSKKSSVPTAAQHFAKQITDAWGVAPALLDASDLSVTSSGHQLDEIGATCAEVGATIVPVTRLTYDPAYQIAVTRMTIRMDAGIALRVSLAEMTDAKSWSRKWKHAIEQTDLVIDLSNSASDVAALGVSVTEAFKALHNGARWRSVTVAGTSIPATLTGFKLGGNTVDRTEYLLWRRLAAADLPYALDFGDYGSIAPGAPVEIPGPTPIHAKYSLPDKFLIFRGVKTKGPDAIPMDRQLRNYAQAIGVHPRRSALAHCWGDSRIDAIRDASTPTAGNPGTWVGINLNRHIEVTRYTLP